MPVHVSFDEDIIVMRMEGQYSTADIRAALDDALSRPVVRQPLGMLFDVRPSEVLVERETRDVREMALFLATAGPRYGSRLALVADADYAYGLMRLGAVIAEQRGTASAVFRAEAEARDWLRRAEGDQSPTS